MGGLSLKEAAAIAELTVSVMRTAIEKKFIAPRVTRVGKPMRYAFGVKDLFFVKLLSAFPLPLTRDDKHSLHDIVFYRSEHAGRWHAAGPELLVESDGLVAHVEVKRLRNRLAQNLATYRRGRRRIVSRPDTLGGEPVFEGTRIPLAHVAAMVGAGVDADEILEDYPALSARDLAYAAIYFKMKPRPGRPRKPLELRRRRSNEPQLSVATSDR